MNIEYISGFFDADGSITISKSNKHAKYKSIKVDFSNNEKYILESIQNYLQKFNIKSYISTKPSKKITHKESYTLSVQGSYALILCKLLKSKHSKKLHRINCINKYWINVTVRNGKYNNTQIQRKLSFERLFFYTLM
jgi:intein/homing endonuclease